MPNFEASNTRPAGCPPGARLLARRVARIGVLRLWYVEETDQLFVSLDNRTYHHVHGPVAPERVPAWLREFDLAPCQGNETSEIRSL